ncbi:MULTISPECIES: hypothetical protein [Flavobacterium]|uniref:hypothetical protein n=1 Tax=Flavobacterium TaxID=237 RepID=UPI0018E748B0|nr:MULTISPECIES: hypothetical protein [Flavobacterium]MBJ2123712.1 hypothetical protein [Flavobacterium sp. IB48]
MKKIILLIFLVLISCKDTKYQPLTSKEADVESLLKKINPNKEYAYWEINFSLPLTPKVIFYKGDKKLKQKNNYQPIQSGFFTGCQPMSCSYTIIYFDNNKWNYVLKKEELITYINKIDNPEEAFLIAKIQDFDIDPYNPKGNGYLKTKNGYDLKVMKYISCPESKESFLVSIDSLGQLKSIKSQGFYLKTKNCIVY